MQIGELFQQARKYAVFLELQKRRNSYEDYI